MQSCEETKQELDLRLALAKLTKFDVVPIDYKCSKKNEELIL
jgi:hypothetical protein